MTPTCPWKIPALLAAHSRRWPAQNPSLTRLCEHWSAEPDTILLRSTMRGHATGTCLIIDPVNRTMLEIFHKGMGAWMPPGGHIDIGETPRQAAIREAAEEVGIDPALLGALAGLEDTGGLLDIDTHPIGARPAKSEGAHFHHDFLFAFILTKPFDPSIALSEVDGFRWRAIGSELDTNEPFAEQNARIAKKLSALGF